MTVAQEASGAALAPAASETAERLFQEHSGWIYGDRLRFLRSPEEAEDALQATYLNACRSLSVGVRPSVSSAWLLRIAQNVCLTRVRSSGRRDRLEHVQDVTILEETVARARPPRRGADRPHGRARQPAGPATARHPPARVARPPHREVAAPPRPDAGGGGDVDLPRATLARRRVGEPRCARAPLGAPRPRPRRAHHGGQELPPRGRRREDRRRGHRRRRHDRDGRGQRSAASGVPGPTLSRRKRQSRSCVDNSAARGLERLDLGSRRRGASFAGPAGRAISTWRACLGTRAGVRPGDRRRSQIQGQGDRERPRPRTGEGCRRPEGHQGSGPAEDDRKAFHPARRPAGTRPGARAREGQERARLPLSLASTWPGSLGCAR